MKPFIFILTLISSTTLFSQTYKKTKHILDVYNTGDSIFNSLVTNNIETVLFYFLTRNEVETNLAEDNSTDQICSYIFWQTSDSSFIKKVNSSYIYKTRSELRKHNTSDKAIGVIFDYYNYNKNIIDSQEFRPNHKDLLTSEFDVFGRDTVYGFRAFYCSDCNSISLKYKIGNSFKKKQWQSIYFDSDNKFFRHNLNTELYQLILIVNSIITKHDNSKFWYIDSRE